ncbi:MAG: redox-sensing transcriptional repressor Rex [bacterium]|nr:redox-sensing transcriptional repressor Rex [bacterium]
MEAECGNSKEAISVATLRRMPTYLRYLKIAREKGVENVSSVTMAKDLNLNSVQVKKDIGFASKVPGKPKIGFNVAELIADIEELLGCYNIKDAVLVGVGKLGKTLLSYNGFKNFGLNVVAAFDENPMLWNTEINGKVIYPVSKIPDILKQSGAKMGIIAVPKAAAQEVCDKLVSSGVKGIWNFAAAHLNVPDGIALKNEDLAASLAILSQQLTEILRNEQLGAAKK